MADKAADKRGKRHVVLSDFKARKEQEGAIDIETDSGVFTILPPELWPDAALDPDADPITGARALLGDRYDDFVAAGGSAAIISAIVTDEHGLSMGESPAS